MPRDLPSIVRVLADRVSAELGVSVYHVERRGGRLSVLVDAPGAVPLETCARFSRRLSAELDARGIIAEHYFLEVSSPGIERRLYEPEHFKSALGRIVQVRTERGKVEGPLRRADENGFELEVVRDGRTSTERFGYSEVRSARIKVADAELFARTGKPRVVE